MSNAAVSGNTTNDIEIGAVEIKDGASDNRADVNAANTARTTATEVLAVQQVDDLGLVTKPIIAAISATFTRPGSGDTTAYAALDAVSTSTSAPAVITFTGMARVIAGSGYIVKAQLATDQKTNVARFRLHLFNASPTAINDNSPYLTLYANIANRVGVIDFPALATEDPTNSTQAVGQLVPGAGNIPLSFVTLADANLYGILETLDAFTPASGQSFTIRLGVDQN